MNYQVLRILAYSAGYIAAAIIGVMFTLYSIDQDINEFLAGGYGLGIALALALIWHAIIWQVSVLERWYHLVPAVLVAFLVFSMSMNLTGHAVTTMLGGQGLLRSQQAQALPEFEVALAAANDNVEAQQGIVGRVAQSSVAAEMLANEEGRSGQGPAYRELMNHSANLEALATEISNQLDYAEAAYDEGSAALDDAREALGDTDAFDDAIARASAAIRKLNAVDVAPVVLNYGMVETNGGSSVLSKETRALHSDVKRLQVEPVEVPTYVSATAGEAVRTADGAAAEWFKAALIEGLPLFFIFLLIIGRNDEGVRAKRDVRGARSDEVRSKREDIIGSNTQAAE